MPAPARYAVHKLIDILARDHPFVLSEAYAEARSRGPERRTLLDQAVSLLPQAAQDALAR